MSKPQVTLTFPKLDVNIWERDTAQLERLGVRYDYGGKAPSQFFNYRDLENSLKLSLKPIKGIDCSGYFRLMWYRATGGHLIPDGSQAQRGYFEELAEKGVVRKVAYRDAAMHMTDVRFFACFIKPHTNGCGEVGHVWGLSQFDDGNNGTKAGTLESHGGTGVNSRPWNYPTLLREVYSCYAVQTVQGGF